MIDLEDDDDDDCYFVFVTAKLVEPVQIFI